MPRLSIVIPWVGPSGPFEDTLAAVLQNRPNGCEVLVAVAHPYDDPYGLTDEVTFIATPHADLITMVNRCIEAATAPVVQIIPCGMQVTESWTSAALLHFAEAEIAAVAPVIVNDKDHSRVLAAGINFSRGGARLAAHGGQPLAVEKLVQSPPMAAALAGGFFRRSVLLALGGFDAKMGEASADLDLAFCLGELGLRVECEPTSVLLATAVNGATGSYSEGLQLEKLFWKHLTADQRKDRVVQHYLCCAAEAGYALLQPWWLARLAGRAAGWLASFGSASTADRIAIARECLAADEGPQILSLHGKRASQAVDRNARRAA